MLTPTATDSAQSSTLFALLVPHLHAETFSAPSASFCADDMELDLVTAGEAEDGAVEADNTGDTADLEAERCGICMDVVIDRGLLDCCEHWFCFACIDNWATITNLCPLCQNEFQLITCVPVFDTIGTDKFEEESFSREDDWSVEGGNNTLSFPSYYIDENAVFCLEGNGCKVRDGSANAEGDSYLDTSIACDSCDIWYHAFCVGFDPEGPSEDTWLCPRCIDHQMQMDSNASSTLESHISFQDVGSRGCSVEKSLSGKVSVSLADAGETALVVSMVVADHPEPYESQQPIIGVGRSKTTSSTSEAPLAKTGEICPKLEPQELEATLSQDPSFNLHANNTLASGKLTPNCDHLVEGHDINNADRAKARATEEVPQQTPSDNIILKDVQTIDDAEDNAVKAIGAKRKHAQSSGDIDADSEETKAISESRGLKKKRRTAVKVILGDQASAMVPDDPKSSPAPKPDKEDMLQCIPESSDIMSIVRGTERSSSKGLKGRNRTDKASVGGESGLRVKKIMRRAVEDKDSLTAVQMLRKQIREAVQNKSSKEIGERMVDPKLLAAFRAAVTGTDNDEPVKKLPNAAIKAKKFMLQKGKVRENLTKKIYASSSGKRKRAWDRECEVEFWKYRCTRTMRPEKIETLKSVLGLLKRRTESLDVMQGSEQHSEDSILSRLYLADTSVFPRKDNIKSLSNSEAASTSQQNKAQICSTGNNMKQSLDNHAMKPMETNKNVLNSTNVASSVRATPSKRPERPLAPPTGVSKGNIIKETVEEAGDIKSDKRKWALAVLARKAASTGKSATSEHGDTAIFKGNYPLLAQLPADMRPTLTPARHNKIPQSVRQAQLYRLTEHFLKKANVSSNCRTAEAELAVADAVNVEKSVADRSNIKLVYVNLCSQEILHRTGNSHSTKEAESNPSPPPETSTEKSDEGIDEQLAPEVEAALRATGLLSDSPPGSPEEYGEPHKVSGTEGSENILELDSNPDIDIYGDFQYDLGDEDYVGASAIKYSTQEPEEGVAKMKVVFSTFGSERSNDIQDSAEVENVKLQDDSSSLLKFDKNTNIETSPAEDGQSNKPCESDKILPGEGDGEEPSAAEYEELYGPDKEPLFMNCPVVLVENNGLNDKETQDENEDPGDCESSDSSHVRKQGGPKSVDHKSPSGKHSRGTSKSQTNESEQGDARRADSNAKKQSGGLNSIMKKVEAYIKEHIRPLCKSGVISPDQYRWAVSKTTDKVMRYHSKAKNANFLIKEGEKVKRLAEQYAEAAQNKEQECDS